ncbi:MAG: hypothetical protein ACUVTX_03295 [Bacteroidales bacterium]
MQTISNNQLVHVENIIIAGKFQNHELTDKSLLFRLDIIMTCHELYENESYSLF